MATTTRTDYEALLVEASQAGMAALEAATPTPMVVYEADGLTDKPKPGGQSWYESDGACGFAWVVIRPATTGFARWLKKNRFEVDRSIKEVEGGSWGTSYYGGYQFWVWAGGQSVDRKSAFADAFAGVLKQAGYDAYPQSRLD
jgi:hypothetical protein